MSTAKETKDLRQFTLHIDYATIMRSYLELLRVREANSNFQLFRFSMIISMAVKSAKKLINKKVGEKKKHLKPESSVMWIENLLFIFNSKTIPERVLGLKKLWLNK